MVRRGLYEDDGEVGIVTVLRQSQRAWWCSILAATGQKPAVSSEQSTDGPAMAAPVNCRGKDQGDHLCNPAQMAGGKK